MQTKFTQIREKLEVRLATLLCGLVAVAAMASEASAQIGPPTDETGTRLFEVFNGFTSAEADDGCNITTTAIDIRRETREPDGLPSVSAYVTVQRGNRCTNEFTVNASGEISFVSMAMAPDAQSGHAVAQGTVTNYIDGSQVSVFVDVSFVEPTQTYKFSQAPIDGSPVHGTGATGRYEGVIGVGGVNFLTTGGSFISERASLDRWRYVTG